MYLDNQYCLTFANVDILTALDCFQGIFDLKDVSIWTVLCKQYANDSSHYNPYLKTTNC